MAYDNSHFNIINNNNNKTMTTIKRHLELERARAKPSELRIKELEKILKRGTLTLEEWRMTGKFIPADEHLISDCKEVVEYVGNNIIQVLNTGDFIFEDTTSKSLEEVEDKMWIFIAEKLWCEKC